MRDENGNKSPDCTYHQIYINLFLIEDIVKEKGVENLTGEEALCYLIHMHEMGELSTMDPSMKETAMAKCEELLKDPQKQAEVCQQKDAQFDA